MQINRVILERRRALGLTQEQLAAALGVTAPAVNKWEKGASCPDLGLLCPLARLLKIDLNELMGFHENLSDEENQHLAMEVMQITDRDGLDAGFARARELLREYSNCGLLIYTVAATLQGVFGLSAADAQREEYQAQLDRWFEAAADCDDPRVRDRVRALLAGRYTARKDWDAAQRVIDAMPERPDLDKRMAQANLFAGQERHEEAAKLMQSVVLSAATEVCGALQLLACEELAAGNRDCAAAVARALERAVEDLDLWRYTGLAAPLECAAKAKDAPESLRRLRQLLDALAEPWRPGDSPLYQRISDGRRGTLNARVYEPLLALLETGSDFDFLREEAKFQAILGEFRERAAAAKEGCVTSAAGSFASTKV